MYVNCRLPCSDPQRWAHADVQGVYSASTALPTPRLTGGKSDAKNVDMPKDLPLLLPLVSGSDPGETLLVSPEVCRSDDTAGLTRVAALNSTHVCESYDLLLSVNMSEQTRLLDPGATNNLVVRPLRPGRS